MDPSPPLDADRLLAHAAWVRRLAGQLVGDPDVADDAAQDAFAAALRSGPRETSRTKAWFAAVVRSFVRRRARSDERRARREEGAAQAERVDSTAQVVERAQASRVVVNAVLELPEPYRTTILMRWFDDLPPARIAELRDEPVETVRTRLKRGHALLREWLSGLQALVVLAEPSRPAAVVTGGWVMTTFGKVAAGVVAATAVTGATWTLQSSEPRRAEAPASEVAAAPSPSVPVGSTTVVASAPAVVQETAPAPAPPVAPAKPASPWSDVTAANWRKLVKEDDGETMKKAIAGLEDETLDLAKLFGYLDKSFEDSIAVPGTEEVTRSGGRTEVTWVQVYSNEKHERSAAKLSFEVQEKSRNATLVLDASSWARERAATYGLPPDQLQTKLTVHVIKYDVGNGFIGGFVKLWFDNSGASPADSKALADKLQFEKKEKRLPSWARFQFQDGQGHHGWTRSDSELPITVSEMERITAVYERFSKAVDALLAAQSEAK
jgi:RNA polymerase sigma-70 factor (ECF subfamily)